MGAGVSWLAGLGIAATIGETVVLISGGLGTGALAYGILEARYGRTGGGKLQARYLAAGIGLGTLLWGALGGWPGAGMIDASLVCAFALSNDAKAPWRGYRLTLWSLVALGAALHDSLGAALKTELLQGTEFPLDRETLALLFWVVGGFGLLLEERMPETAVQRPLRFLWAPVTLAIAGICLVLVDSGLRRETAGEVRRRLAGAVADFDPDEIHSLQQGERFGHAEVFRRAGYRLGSIFKLDTRTRNTYLYSLKDGDWRVAVDAVDAGDRFHELDERDRPWTPFDDPAAGAALTPPVSRSGLLLVTVTHPVWAGSPGERLLVVQELPYTLWLSGNMKGRLLTVPLLACGVAAGVAACLARRRRREAIDTARAMTAVGQELRGPIQGILGHAELLRLGSEGAREAEALRALKGDAAQLAHLMRQMLDLSSLKSGHLELRPESVEVRPFFEVLCEIQRPEAAAKRLELMLQILADVPKGVFMDPIRFRQVMVNLLANGLRYTEEGSVRLTVAWDAVRKHLICHVKDTGRGMSAEDCRRVFGVSPAEPSRSVPGAEGWGLGLSITRQLLECMKGDLTVHSEEGQGTEVSVRLPVEVVAHAPAKAGEGPDALSGVEIWIVEDQLTIGNLFVEYARALGAIPTLLASIRETKEQLEEFSAPDVLIVDRRLTDGDGFELAAQGPLQRNSRIWKVAMSADDSDESRAAAANSGWDAFMVKPCDLAEFSQAVGSCPWFGELKRQAAEGIGRWKLDTERREALEAEAAGLLVELDLLAAAGNTSRFAQRLHVLINCLIFLGGRFGDFKQACLRLEKEVRADGVDAARWRSFRGAVALELPVKYHERLRLES